MIYIGTVENLQRRQYEVSVPRAQIVLGSAAVGAFIGLAIGGPIGLAVGALVGAFIGALASGMLKKIKVCLDANGSVYVEYEFA